MLDSREEINSAWMNSRESMAEHRGEIRGEIFKELTGLCECLDRLLNRRLLN
jgi:hypothetical protein